MKYSLLACSGEASDFVVARGLAMAMLVKLAMKTILLSSMLVIQREREKRIVLSNMGTRVSMLAE